MKVAVIGGGAFGAMAALRLAEAGHAVSLFERKPQLMQGASYNNQNRLHLGFHYPRDDETALQCIRGFDRFVAEFRPCILSGFANAYFIANEGSHVSPEAYLEFCRRVGLKYRPLDIASFKPEVRGVSMGIFADEMVYDSAMVRESITGRLRRSAVEIHFSEEVLALEREGNGYRLHTTAGERIVDAVVNCCYTDINRLTSQIGHEIAVRQYEYTAVPIVELDLPQQTGITIMDGPFLTLLPFGRTGRYLLYHVEHAVIAREDSQLMNHDWLDPDTSPFATVDWQSWWEELVDRSSAFVPALRGARAVGQLQGPRMVLANQDHTDARPSSVTQMEPGYITVFSGKIDHCTWVADDVAEMLGAL